MEHKLIIEVEGEPGDTALIISRLQKELLAAGGNITIEEVMPAEPPPGTMFIPLELADPEMILVGLKIIAAGAAAIRGLIVLLREITKSANEERAETRPEDKEAVATIKDPQSEATFRYPGENEDDEGNFLNSLKGEEG